MKKFLGGMLVLAVAVTLGVATPVGASVNDYTISTYDIQYVLGRDAEGRSTLQTRETITAEFPEIDQNHGIERAIPSTYDGHSTSLTINAVKDATGNSLGYTTYDKNDLHVLRIGNADTYVHGTKTYIIEYTQRDVTKYFADTGRDEFYWDTNGDQWLVPIHALSVRLVVDKSIAENRTGAVACYYGVFGSTNRCQPVSDSTQEVVVQQNGFAKGENVTLALGFEKGTFAAYKMSLIERLIALWAVINTVLFVVSVALGIWLIVRFNRITNRTRDVGTIIPEYLPPSGASVTTSARVTKRQLAVMTAQLLDLAVRHYIKLYEVKEKTLFSPAEYEIEIVKDIGELRWEEQELLKDTFGATPAVGERFNLKGLRNNTSYYLRTTNNDKDLDQLIRGSYNFRHSDEPTRQWFRRAGVVILIVGILTLSFGLVFVGLGALIASFVVWTLTDEGLALKRYLEGLKLYIGVAEQERIRMLQSPEGAEKVASVANGTDTAQLIKLYERVLPYAVLFRQEKQWNEQLGRYYEASGQQPDWYSGHAGAFNAAAFTSAMSGFATSNTYASSSSSSSGGSSGGGSSGGGGGGGGGGGW